MSKRLAMGVDRSPVESGYRTMSPHIGWHRQFREIVWPHSLLYLTLARLGVTPKIPQEYFGRGFDLCIAGYPRSGNTYAVNLVHHTQKRRMRIASHSHCPPLIKYLVANGVPSCLLIREPQDAAISWAICQACTLDEALEFYVLFHRLLWPLRDRMVVARFEITIFKLGKVFETLNERFEMDLNCAFDQGALDRQIFDSLEKADRLMEKTEAMIARPSEFRKLMKRRLERESARSSTRALMDRAQRLYERFAELSVGKGLPEPSCAGNFGMNSV